MPLYEFECYSCPATETLVKPISKAPKSPRKCRQCGGEMGRNYRTHQFSVFKPYTEDRLGDEPVVVTSPEHRDQLFKKHNVTCDKVTALNKPAASVTDQITLDEVLDEARRNPQPAVNEVFRGRVTEGLVDTGSEE